MQKIVILLFCFISFSVNSQTIGGPFFIKGKIGLYNSPAKIYLQYMDNTKLMTETSELKNGVFSFSGQINAPVNGRIILAPNGESVNEQSNTQYILPIVLSAENIQIESPDNLLNAVITGSSIDMEKNEMLNMTSPIINQIERLMEEFAQQDSDRQQNEEYVKSVQSRYMSLMEQINNKYIEFIKSHPNSYLSLMILQELEPALENANITDDLLKGLNKELQEQQLAKDLSKSINVKKQTSVGSIAPEFIQNNPDGKPIKLSDFRGKYLLVDFWASWCGPCRKENPYLVQVYKKFKDQNFEILGVSLDNPGQKTAWLNAIKKDQLSWPQVSDLKGWQNDVATQYKIVSIPQNLLLDPDGVIIAKNVKGEDLLILLEELLGKAENSF